MLYALVKKASASKISSRKAAVAEIASTLNGITKSSRPSQWYLIKRCPITVIEHPEERPGSGYVSSQSGRFTKEHTDKMADSSICGVLSEHRDYERDVEKTASRFKNRIITPDDLF